MQNQIKKTTDPRRSLFRRKHASNRLVLRRIFARLAEAVLPPGLSRNILGAFRFGDRIKCPICLKRFGSVMPRDQRQAKKRCPFCLSKARHCLLWLYLKNKTNFFSAQLKVLHLNPLPVFSWVFGAMKNLDYCPTDFSSTNPALKVDATCIPDSDATYDVVLASHILEHITDDRKAIREFYRVLKPGGWAIFQVPVQRGQTIEDESVVSPQERKRVFGRANHVRRYGADFKDRLEEAGFEVKVDRYARTLGTKIKRFGLRSKLLINFCTKQP